MRDTVTMARYYYATGAMAGGNTATNSLSEGQSLVPVNCAVFPNSRRRLLGDVGDVVLGDGASSSPKAKYDQMVR